MDDSRRRPDRYVVSLGERILAGDTADPAILDGIVKLCMYRPEHVTHVQLGPIRQTIDAALPVRRAALQCAQHAFAARALRATDGPLTEYIERVAKIALAMPLTALGNQQVPPDVRDAVYATMTRVLLRRWPRLVAALWDGASSRLKVSLALRNAMQLPSGGAATSAQPAADDEQQMALDDEDRIMMTQANMAYVVVCARSTWHARDMMGLVPSFDATLWQPLVQQRDWLTKRLERLATAGEAAAIDAAACDWARETLALLNASAA